MNYALKSSLEFEKERHGSTEEKIEEYKTQINSLKESLTVTQKTTEYQNITLNQFDEKLSVIDIINKKQEVLKESQNNSDKEIATLKEYYKLDIKKMDDNEKAVNELKESIDLIKNVQIVELSARMVTIDALEALKAENKNWVKKSKLDRCYLVFKRLYIMHV